MIHIFLPVSLTNMNILIPLGMGLTLGLLFGLFRVGGGFLATPLYILFGIAPAVARATDINHEFVVQQFGLIEKLADMTRANSPAYGFLLVFVALVAGFLVGLIFRLGVGLIFKNDGRITDHV